MVDQTAGGTYCGGVHVVMVSKKTEKEVLMRHSKESTIRLLERGRCEVGLCNSVRGGRILSVGENSRWFGCAEKLYCIRGIIALPSFPLGRFWPWFSIQNQLISTAASKSLAAYMR